MRVVLIILFTGRRKLISAIYISNFPMPGVAITIPLHPIPIISALTITFTSAARNIIKTIRSD